MLPTTKLILFTSVSYLFIGYLILKAEVINNGQAPKLGDADYPRPSPSARHDQKVKAISEHNYEVALIGDSITHTLGELGGKYDPMKKVWSKHFDPLKAINLGHNGYRTEQILWNLQNGELNFKKSPKVAMLLIGTNNSDDRRFKSVHTAEQIFSGTKAIVQTIQKRHPKTKILVLRIFPRGGDNEKGISPPTFNSSAKCIETCRRAGTLTRQLADGKKVFWLDINQLFLNKSTKEINLAMSHLSFIAHAYIWGGAKPNSVLVQFSPSSKALKNNPKVCLNPIETKIATQAASIVINAILFGINFGTI